MRFTKIPLIATLMAVALSLLIVLPGLAQQTTDITDGKLSGGGGSLVVGVFANIADAELAKLEDGGTDRADGTDIYVPIKPEPPAPAAGTGSHAAGDTAWLAASLTSSPRETFFRNTLYVSNNVGAYNTILINVNAEAHGLTGNCLADVSATTDVDEARTPHMTATVRNSRAGGDPVQVQLFNTDADNFQAFIKVVEDGASGTYDSGTPADTSDDVEVDFRQFNGPTWCDDSQLTRQFDATDDGTDNPTPVQIETEATSAVYGPVPVPGHGQDLAGDPPPAAQEIATIFARHGDRLTITAGGAQLELTVDGDGPTFSAVTPEDDAVTRKSRLTYSFEVRDDDSGLRHDGESIVSPDGDREEINPDGDQHLGSEPLSENPGTVVTSNGPAADIDVNVGLNPSYNPGQTTTDISASGTWRSASSRAGVAYSFAASGADKTDGHYVYQVVAKDRAGNESKTDAVNDTPDSEPFVFEVDDTDPDLAVVRTGISYDTEDDEETVDRSYIALTFADSDALGDVDTGNINVVGHTIVDFILPSKAPRVVRGETRYSSMPDRATIVTATAPTLPTANGIDDDADATTPVADAEETRPNDCGLLDDDDAATNPDSTQLCTAWSTYDTEKATYDGQVAVYEQAVEDYMDDNPATDIAGDTISDPRSRIYLELSEDLASDAEPDVVVVGGAVFDLAGNTNAAETVDSDDWIAPNLTVTVTGTAGDRPVANRDGSFTVDVRSDEDVNRPKVYFVMPEGALNDGGDGYDYTIADSDEGASLTQQEDENHWSKKYNTDSGDLDRFAGFVGIIVTAGDDNGNSGATAGWSPTSHRDSNPPSDAASARKIVLGKMDGAGLLVEIDVDFNGDEDPVGTVTPRSSSDGTETESANPFVKLTFGDEGGEYDTCPPTIEGEDGTTTGGCASGVDALEDSHDTVQVTEITLNGTDAMANLNRVSATSFSLVTRDLAVDTHEVTYTAVDDAGNEYEGEFSFEVKERAPYAIKVQPGWNLVSLPATPLESGIADVLANNQYITPVLGYQEGDWLTAVREDDGTWRGRLTEIVGGYGYWVHARTFESISTMLAEVDPAGTLPTVPVTAGWNLLGVLDIFQNGAGNAPGVAGGNGDEADSYFSSIPWRVAYTYNTSHSLWEKRVPGVDTNVLNDDGTVKTTPVLNEDGTPKMENGEPVTEPVVEKEILNGNGYWVWSPTPSTLVP